MEGNSEVQQEFFGRNDVMRALQDMLVALKSNAQKQVDLDVTRPLLTIIKSMLSSRQKFDQHCQCNIEWIGSGFFSEMINFVASDEINRAKNIASVFTSAYRFLLELDFSQGYDLGAELNSVKNFVSENIDKFADFDKSQITYAEYIMPARIMKKLMFSPHFGDIRDFRNLLEQASNKKEEFDKELTEREERLMALSKNVDKITTSYNFVALSSGFFALLTDRKKSKWLAFFSMLVLGVFMLFPVVAEIWFVVANIKDVDQHKDTLMYILPAIITVEVILFYFFRVALSHYSSIKAQILQLDLRVSLCQFIQSYSEYANKIKANDKSALEKFEQLIFSGIVASDHEIPSTFDGVEQIGKLIASLKSKGP